MFCQGLRKKAGRVTIGLSNGTGSYELLFRGIGLMCNQEVNGVDKVCRQEIIHVDEEIDYYYSDRCENIAFRPFGSDQPFKYYPVEPGYSYDLSTLTEVASEEDPIRWGQCLF